MYEIYAVNKKIYYMHYWRNDKLNDNYIYVPNCINIEINK